MRVIKLNMLFLIVRMSPSHAFEKFQKVQLTTQKDTAKHFSVYELVSYKRNSCKQICSKCNQIPFKKSVFLNTQSHCKIS